MSKVLLQHQTRDSRAVGFAGLASLEQCAEEVVHALWELEQIEFKAEDFHHLMNKHASIHPSIRENMDEVIKDHRRVLENDIFKILSITVKPVGKIRQNLTEHAWPIVC